MNSTRHLVISIALSSLIIIMGTVGYMIIEGWGLLDSFYMTIITIAAVGYREVQEMTGFGRLFTVFVIFSGVGFTLYVAAAVVQFMVEGRIRVIMGRKRLDRKINRMKNHYILCGYGRIGKVLYRDLERASMDIIVIERDPDLVPLMDGDGILYISGEATDEANLRKAGIERAKGLIAALATDTENVFLVLTARQLAPDLQIIARASQEESKSKLKMAGANSVESPYEMGAVSMAQHIVRPTVTSFLDLAFEHKRKDIQMEEIPVSESSELVNVMLKDSGIRQRFNLIIIAIKNPNGEMLFNPSFEAVIQPHDTVVAVGEVKNLDKLEHILNPKKPNSS